MFVILSGCSGSGKNTIMNELISRHENIVQFTTCTTRDMRPGEVDGVNYHFLTKEQFLEKYNSGEICEMEEIHGNYYGSSLKEIKNKLSEGKILIKDIGVEGAVSLSNILKKEVPVVLIFLKVEKEELRQRLIGRGETQIDLRLSRFDYENSFIDNYDYVIDNKDMETTIAELEKILLKDEK